jgi:hypothetical protein
MMNKSDSDIILAIQVNDINHIFFFLTHPDKYLPSCLPSSPLSFLIDAIAQM